MLTDPGLYLEAQGKYNENNLKENPGKALIRKIPQMHLFKWIQWKAAKGGNRFANHYNDQAEI